MICIAIVRQSENKATFAVATDNTSSRCLFESPFLQCVLESQEREHCIGVRSLEGWTPMEGTRRGTVYASNSLRSKSNEEITICTHDRNTTENHSTRQTAKDKEAQVTPIRSANTVWLIRIDVVTKHRACNVFSPSANSPLNVLT